MIVKEGRYVRCFLCGNTATDAYPLQWEREDTSGELIVTHAWNPCAKALSSIRDGHGDYVGAFGDVDDVPDDATAEYDIGSDGTVTMTCGHPECDRDYPCPPSPEGIGTCAKCFQAGVIGEHPGTYGEVLDGYFSLTLPDGTQIEEGTFRHLGRILPVYFHARDLCPKKERQRQHRGEAKRLLRSLPEGRDGELRDGEPRDTSGDSAYLIAVPLDGTGSSLRDLMQTWKVKERAARDIVRRLLDADTLRFEEVATSTGGAPKKVYWRVAE